VIIVEKTPREMESTWSRGVGMGQMSHKSAL